MAKPATVKIKLVSTADTGFFYVTKKNPRTQTEKMVFKKYDPRVRKHVEFKEAKIKYPSGLAASDHPGLDPGSVSALPRRPLPPGRARPPIVRRALSSAGSAIAAALCLSSSSTVCANRTTEIGFDT